MRKYLALILLAIGTIIAGGLVITAKKPVTNGRPWWADEVRILRHDGE